MKRITLLKNWLFSNMMKKIFILIIAVFFCEINFAQTSSGNFMIGTGIADVTYPTFGMGMQGMADDYQKTTEVETPLYARSFIIADANSQKRVAIIVFDMLSCNQAVKTKVVEAMQNDTTFHHLYNTDNVLISGTHTHSAPGGFSEYFLYNVTIGGFDQMCFDHVVKGIVESMRKAHKNLGPGKVYFNKGNLVDCGRNRSRDAYINNPLAELNSYTDSIDTQMLLLKFVKNNGGTPKNIGVLAWYGIHPTTRGQKNTLITGDVQGWASQCFENVMGTAVDPAETFVCAFANTTAGDVSGNIKYEVPAGGPGEVLHMKEYGNMMYLKAKELFNTATVELDTGITYRYTHLNMSNIVVDSITGARTWPAAVGLSMAAGSTEDSKGYGVILGMSIASNLREGITTDNITLVESGTRTILRQALVGKLPSGWVLPSVDAQEEAGQAPKPIAWPVGRATPYPLVPNVVPIQLIKIGKLAIAGVPGEMTTMSGRRLKTSIKNQLDTSTTVALTLYANAYCGYCTTYEEYQTQNYEGACTLYGPHTLEAYQQEYAKLVHAITNQTSVNIGSPATVVPALLPYPGIDTNMIYVNNRSSQEVRIRVFGPNDAFADTGLGIPDSDKTIDPYNNLLISLPSGKTSAKVRIDNALSVIYQGGSIIIHED